MKPRQSTEDKRRRITAVTLKAFLQGGYEKTNVREILKTAGISTGSFYHLFGTKEEILNSIFKWVLNNFRAHAKEIAREYQEPLLAMSVTAAVQITSILENEEIFNIWRLSWVIRSIEESFVRFRVRATKRILEDADFGFTYEDDEIYARELAVNAAAGALMEGKYKGYVKLKSVDIFLLIIGIWFSAFDIPKPRSERIVETTTELMRKRGKRMKRTFLNAFRQDFK
jgi:AcrR family transcriptional regulator